MALKSMETGKVESSFSSASAHSTSYSLKRMDSATLTVSSRTHKIACADDGTIKINNNIITIQNIQDGTNHDIQINEDTVKQLTHIFGSDLAEKLHRGAEYDRQQEAKDWNRSATVCLISLYEKYEDDIKSPTIRTQTVFAKIAKELNSEGHLYNGTQCYNKFRYLKKRYKRYKDTQKRNGATTQNFPFARDFDRLFGPQPNIVPPLIASSQSNINNHGERVAEVNGSKENRKRKLPTDNIERRHRERIHVAERAIKSFETMMTALIQKL